jgi:hypothetical protein
MKEKQLRRIVGTTLIVALLSALGISVPTTAEAATRGCNSGPVGASVPAGYPLEVCVDQSSRTVFIRNSSEWIVEYNMPAGLSANGWDLADTPLFGQMYGSEYASSRPKDYRLLVAPPGSTTKLTFRSSATASITYSIPYEPNFRMAHATLLMNHIPIVNDVKSVADSVFAGTAKYSGCRRDGRNVAYCTAVYLGAFPVVTWQFLKAFLSNKGKTIKWIITLGENLNQQAKDMLAGINGIALGSGPKTFTVQFGDTSPQNPQTPSAQQPSTAVQQPVVQSATPAQPVITVGSVIINSSYGTCQYGSNCLIAGFSLSGFSPVPAVYTCVFSNGARYDFSLSGSSVGTACITNEGGDSITIEVGGVRSATISNNASSNATPNLPVVNSPVTQTPVAQSPVVATPATPATPAVPAPVAGTSSPVLGTVSAAGRVGPCTFGSSCLIASFSIAGFSPQPTRYTCIFSDGSRYDFSFGGSSVNTACYTNARPDSITIEVAGVRSGVLANSAAPAVAPVTPTPTPTPTSSVRTYTEQAGTAGSPTFLNPVNAGGPGQRIGAMTYVEVFCKVYAPQIASVNPDGYWYKVASAPWSGTYFAPANNFWNGDVPGVKPYVHNTDFAVPDC